MNTDQLRYFLAVARCQNFTEAAKEFYITQPAITHQIARVFDTPNPQKALAALFFWSNSDSLLFLNS